MIARSCVQVNANSSVSFWIGCIFCVYIYTLILFLYATDSPLRGGDEGRVNTASTYTRLVLQHNPNADACAARLRRPYRAAYHRGTFLSM